MNNFFVRLTLDHAVTLCFLIFALYTIVTRCFVYPYLANKKKKAQFINPNEPWRRIKVSMESIGIFKPPIYEFEGLDFDYQHFPEALAKYIKYNGRENLARYLLLVNGGDQTDKERNDMCRAITIAAAINDTVVPFQLVLVDERTQALAHALANDLHEISVQWVGMYTLEANTVVTKGHPYDFLLTENFTPLMYQRREGILTTYQPHLQAVGEVVMEFYLGENFPTFINFARRLEKKKLSREDIKSLVTAFAAITGIKIPCSYLSYDALSILLMDPYKLPAAVPNNLSLVK